MGPYDSGHWKEGVWRARNRFGQRSRSCRCARAACASRICLCFLASSAIVLVIGSQMVVKVQMKVMVMAQPGIQNMGAKPVVL